MKSLFVAVALVATQATALEFKGNAIILTPEEIAQCNADGGCGVFTQKHFLELMNEAYQEGLKDAQQSCKKTDWRKTAKREGWDG